MTIEQIGHIVLPHQGLVTPSTDQVPISDTSRQMQKEKTKPRFGNAKIHVESDGQLLGFESFDSTDFLESYVFDEDQIKIPYGGNAFCTYREGYFVFRYYKKRPNLQLHQPALGIYFGYKIRRFEEKDRQHILILNPDVEIVKARINTPQKVEINGITVNVDFEQEKKNSSGAA